MLFFLGEIAACLKENLNCLILGVGTPCSIGPKGSRRSKQVPLRVEDIPTRPLRIPEEREPILCAWGALRFNHPAKNPYWDVPFGDNQEKGFLRVPGDPHQCRDSDMGSKWALLRK